MMMLSLLETVLVMFLLHKDTKELAEKEQSMIEDFGYKESDVSIKNYYTGEIHDHRKVTHLVKLQSNI